MIEILDVKALFEIKLKNIFGEKHKAVSETVENFTSKEHVDLAFATLISIFIKLLIEKFLFAGHFLEEKFRQPILFEACSLVVLYRNEV